MMRRPCRMTAPLGVDLQLASVDTAPQGLGFFPRRSCIEHREVQLLVHVITGLCSIVRSIVGS